MRPPYPLFDFESGTDDEYRIYVSNIIEEVWGDKDILTGSFEEIGQIMRILPPYLRFVHEEMEIKDIPHLVRPPNYLYGV